MSRKVYYITQLVTCVISIIINVPSCFIVSGVIVNKHTVPLNYNFTFTRVSTRVTTRGSHGRCQNLPWKGSFPCDRPWLFHAKTRGISRHVAFPRNESWNFHETSYRGISRGIFTRPVVVALKSQWLVKAFTIRNLFTVELF